MLNKEICKRCVMEQNWKWTRIKETIRGWDQGDEYMWNKKKEVF